MSSWTGGEEARDTEGSPARRDPAPGARTVRLTRAWFAAVSSLVFGVAATLAYVTTRGFTAAPHWPWSNSRTELLPPSQWEPQPEHDVERVLVVDGKRYDAELHVYTLKAGPGISDVDIEAQIGTQPVPPALEARPAPTGPAFTVRWLRVDTSQGASTGVGVNCDAIANPQTTRVTPEVECENSSLLPSGTYRAVANFGTLYGADAGVTLSVPFNV